MTPPPSNGSEETPSLELAPILALHRHRDGRIAFSRKVNGAWDNTFSLSLTTEELRSMFATVAEHLIRDSYISLNAYYRPGPFKDKATGLPIVGVDKWRPEGRRLWGRVTENLRYLCACYVDIDCGRSPETAKTPLETMSRIDATRRVEDLQHAGVLPPFSIFVRSGQGISLLWLLRDEDDPTTVPAAYNWRIPLWKRIAYELWLRAHNAELPADRQGSLITQVYRPPGIVNSKTGKRVRWELRVQGDDGALTYTLDELRSALALPAPPTESLPLQLFGAPAQLQQFQRKTRRPGSAPGKRKSQRDLYAKRARDLRTIEANRGGFMKRGMPYKDGYESPGRRFTLTIYANCLLGSGVPESEALRALSTMAENCRPPYGSDPGDTPTPADICARVYRQKSARAYNNQKRTRKDGRVTFGLCENLLHNDLTIAADYAREWGLESIMPDTARAERDAARPTMDSLVTLRKEEIKRIVAFHNGNVPPDRKLAEMLAARGVVNPHTQKPYSYEQIRNDCKALGYPSAPPGRRRRR